MKLPPLFAAWRQALHLLRSPRIARRHQRRIDRWHHRHPLAMALAIAVGVAPQHGLYTVLVAAPLIALTGAHASTFPGRRRRSW